MSTHSTMVEYFSKCVVIVATNCRKTGTYACFVLFYLFKHEKMFLPGDLNPCHPLRSQTPIPLCYIYCYMSDYEVVNKEK